MAESIFKRKCLLGHCQQKKKDKHVRHSRVQQVFLCIRWEGERCKLFRKNFCQLQTKGMGEDATGSFWDRQRPRKERASAEISCVNKKGRLLGFEVTWLFSQNNCGSSHLEINIKFQYTQECKQSLVRTGPQVLTA